MNNNKKFFIRVNRVLVEVPEEIYREHHKMERRARYIEERDLIQGKVLYSDMDTDEMTGEDMMPDLNAESVENVVLQRIAKGLLEDALAVLSNEELGIIEMLYFADDGGGLSQREVAKIIGISQPAVHKRHEKIIKKLKKLTGL